VPQKFPQRSQRKHNRKKYRVRRWREYEAALCKRGDLTIWLSEDAIGEWHAAEGKKPGGQYRYSDLAIETALPVRAVYGLALRQTEGFLRSIASLLQLDIDIPDHTTRTMHQTTQFQPESSSRPCVMRKPVPTQASIATNEKNIRKSTTSKLSSDAPGTAGQLTPPRIDLNYS
jgi:hypothetical protein